LETQNNLGDFLAHLDPKLAKKIKCASEADSTVYPLSSRGLTRDLSGGIGRGKMTLLYGNTSSGKSLLMLQSIGLWQKQGLICAYVDAEGTLNPEFAQRLGVDTDQLIYISKKSFGAVTDEVVPLVEAGIDVLVIDSISIMLPEVFVDADGGAAEFEKMKQIGAHAKSTSIMVNALHYANHKTAIVIISQTTTKIANTYTQQVPHGGVKLPFACAQIIKLQSSATETNQIKRPMFVGNKVTELPIGRPVEYVVEKNKLGPQSRAGKYNLYYDGPMIGVDRTDELITLAVATGAVSKGGSWFKFEDQQWQGQSALVQAVKEDPALEQAIESELELALGGGVVG
jgi:recombination protein RecA